MDGAWTQVRSRWVLVDIAVALALIVGDLVVAPWLGLNQMPSGAEPVLMILTCAAMPLRRWSPLTALVLSTTGGAALVSSYGTETFAVLAPLLALYSVALEGDRRSTVLSWAATAGVLSLAAALHLPSEPLVQGVLPVLPWTAVAAAIGEGLRNRRDYIAAIVERAERAERSRDQEARRRVAEERVRIARELHDVVAHHIAVVNVQAGVAQHLLSDQPERAAEALATVRGSAATVLEELGDVLSVLREPGAPAEQLVPAPGLARIDDLLDSFAPAGLEIDWSLHGQSRDLTPTVDLVAYRLIEEGLTNALKHGTGTAHLDLEYGPSTLVLRIVNRTPSHVPAEARTAVSAGTGHGLLGMRERTSAVGGSFSAAPTSTNTFEVEAELPLRVSS